MFSIFHLVIADTGTPLSVSQHALVHMNCLWTCVLSAVYCRRADCWFPSCNNQWCEICLGLEVYLKDTCSHAVLKLLHHHHVLHRELSAWQCILLEHVIVRFKHRLTKQL
jgi:hypothetical protein